MALPSIALRWKAALPRVLTLATHWRAWNIPLNAASVITLSIFGLALHINSAAHQFAARLSIMGL